MLRLAVIFLGLLPVAGCGARTVRPEGLADLRTGFSEIREQARVVFTDANELARDRSLRLVATSKRPVLTKEAFAVIVEPEAQAQWDYFFSVFEEYVSALQQLTSPGRSEAFGNAAVELGSQLARGRTDEPLPAGVATAFAQLGRALIEAKAQRDALAVMGRADPAVREALSEMAKAIRNPLLVSVNANWRTALADLGTTEWGAAVQANDSSAKVAVAERFLELLEKWDAQLTTVERLRQSLLLLADAHTEVAKGDRADARSLISLASRHLDEAKALHERWGRAG